MAPEQELADLSIKLVRTGSSQESRPVLAAIEGLSEPGADATTEFEAGPGRVRIEAYFADARRAQAALAVLRRTLAPELAAGLDAEAVPDLDWPAEVERHLAPVRAGGFIVHGSHDRAVARARSRRAIEIDAGLAFGTARHGTTAGCLAALDRLGRRQRFASVLDLGCGTGVLAIASAKLMPSARIAASDIDPVAVAVARANVRRNGLAGRIGVRVADGFGRTPPRPGFDLVLANILAEPLKRLANGMACRIDAGGVAVLSGLLRHEAASVAAAYRSAGFRLASRLERGGWSVLVLVRRPSARRSRRAPLPLTRQWL